MNRRRLALSALVALASLWAWRATRPADHPKERLGWIEGQSYLYQVSLDNRATIGLALADTAPQEIAVTTQLEATVEVTVESVTADAVVQSWRFAEVSGGSIAAGGRSVASAADLASRLPGPALVVELARDGAIRWLHRDPEADELFAGVMELLAAELSLTRRSHQRAWSALESAHVGDVESAYSVDGPDVRRDRSRYATVRLLPAKLGGTRQSLESTATLRLRTDAMLERFDSRERLEVRGSGGGKLAESEQRLSARLTGHRELRSRSTLSLKRRVAATVGSPRDAGSLERSALEQQRGDLTWERLARFLESPEVGAAGSRGNELLWQSVALLRLEPERIVELSKSLLADDATFDRRMFGFAALAGAGHPAAQKAITDLLDAEPLRVDGVARRRLLQQLSFVARPTLETAAWLADEILQAGGDQSIAAAHSLGSVVRKLRDAGQTDAGERFNQTLRAQLASADDADRRANFISALGNTGVESNVEVLAAHAGDAHERTRSSVAAALRRTPTAAARRVLSALVGDGSPRVQRRALATIEAWHPDQPMLEDVARQLIAAGAPGAYAEALPLVTRLADPSLRRRVLEHMLATAEIDRRMIGRLRAELDRVR